MTAVFESVILIADTALTKAEFEELLLFVSPEKQEKIKRYHFYQDAQNSLLGDILARVEICRATGLSNKQLKFSTNIYGKPFLANHPHVHHNISHAGHYIACALDDQPVGIDIEIIKPIDLKIAERFFAADETAYILSSKDQNAQRFFEVWTKKESRIKWEGKGLSKPLPSFSVFDSTESEQLAYRKIFHNGIAICHVCSTKREAPSVKVIDTVNILRYIK